MRGFFTAPAKRQTQAQRMAQALRKPREREMTRGWDWAPGQSCLAAKAMPAVAGSNPVPAAVAVPLRRRCCEMPAGYCRKTHAMPPAFSLVLLQQRRVAGQSGRLWREFGQRVFAL